MNHNRVVAPPKAFDIFGAVEELHNLSAKEMNKLLRDSQHLFTLRLRTGRGSSIRVDMECLVLSLPLHLLACLASTGAEPRLRYLLRGVRLLHSLSDLALRHPKLEQILLQEVKIREQVLDLIVYVLVTLASPEQEGRLRGSFTLLHAALVACSLHLLPAFVAAEWLDVVPVLLVHPKVDIFMDVAFDAVRRDIVLLQSKLRVLNSKLLSSKITATVAECMAQVIAQQCEASVQVLQSLCQPHAFRDRVLNHKELCRNGGLLRLALTVLKLHLPYFLAESKYMVSLISRLKSKILSMLVKFCETESVSFLDEVAVDVRSMHLAEIVAKEVLGLVRDALLEEPRDIHGSEDDEIPSGLLYIHAMRLADIFSDDSNFRNSVMDHIAPDLAKVLALSPTIFSSGWCGSSVVDDATKPGSDAVLIYDPFRAAGAAMQSFKSSVGSAARASGSSALLADDLSGCSLSAGQIQFASYSQERSSLFVKILANLHCFNPEICAADEKDRFLNLFIECLMVGPFTPGNSAFFLSTVQTAVRVCENLFSLLDHVSSLPSEVVSDEDLQLVSTFYYALHEAICPSGVSDASMQEDPVVAYVKDAHEQKRKILLAQWQRSERWQRIQRLSEPSDKEQSNDGSSINKTTTKTSSSQPGIETDTRQLSEEAQSFGDRPVAKRKREGFGLEDETTQPKKRDNSQQPFEKDVTELEWMGEGAETNEVMDVTMGGGTFVNDMIEEAGKVEVTDTNNEHSQYNTDMAAEYEVARILGIKLPDALPVKIENEEVIQGKQDNFGKDNDDIHLNNCDNFNLGVKVEDVDIYEEAEVSKVQDFHRCMDFSKLEEINKETVLKFQDMSDEAEIMPVVETKQESSQSAVAETAQGNVSERDNQVAGSSRIQKATAGVMCDELQPKKRKRNIMNEKQMAMMENALKTEPDMQRYPKLILQWTNQLNMIGPEISYQQLKNWLNNRKARLARQARETRGFEGEIQVGAYNHEVISSLEPAGQTTSAPGHSSTYSGSSNDPRGALSEDANTRDSDSPMQTSKPSVSTGISQCKVVTEDGGATNRNHMELDAYYKHSCELPDIGLTAGPSHRSASVKFVKCEVGQYVSLLDKDGKEVAVGTVHQVEGVWQGKNIDEHGLCIVKISQLKVDKGMKLPHPSNFTGNTFEEAENMYGRMLVAWDTKRIFLIS